MNATTGPASSSIPRYRAVRDTQRRGTVSAGLTMNTSPTHIRQIAGNRTANDGQDGISTLLGVIDTTICNTASIISMVP